MAKVWNIRDTNVPTDAVYIGRPSRWGNPYTVAEYGRKGAVEKYESWLLSQPELWKEIRQQLRGKDLVCYCAPRQCHGDILLRIANLG